MSNDQEQLQPEQNTCPLNRNGKKTQIYKQATAVTSRKHLRTKVTPDIVKWGKSGVGMKMIKIVFFFFNISL